MATTDTGAGRLDARVRGVLRLVAALWLVLSGIAPAEAANSPLGDAVASWPIAWNAYRYDTGDPVLDPKGDQNPDNSDLSSGPCSGTKCTGTAPSVYYASDGTNAFFRIRIAVDPADATKGGLTGNAYLVQIASGGVVKAVVGVDGKSPSLDYVYVASAPGTTVTSVYEYPFTGTSAGMRVVPDGTGQWFIDYQVPITRITALSGGAVTAATPIQLYYGTSTAANLATLTKDLMAGETTTVSFDGLSVVSLSPAALTVSSDKTYVSGPNPPRAGDTTRYTLTLSTTNTGGGELSGASATATLPAGVSYVSGPAGVSESGGTVTWNAGTLLPGATKTATFTVDLTPTVAMEGAVTDLLSGVAESGTDLGTGAARTASAPALTVGPVAAANKKPVAADDTLSVPEDGSDTVNVLANDLDPDGDALTVSLASGPAHGDVTFLNGVATYTPDAGYEGPDSFTYQACDASSACDTATVAVTVTHVNHDPAAPPGTAFSTEQDTAKSGTLTGSTDPDGDALTFSKTGDPAHGTVTVNPDGTYTYTPSSGYVGPDSFGYQVCDPSNACAAATATVTVTAGPPPNAVPVAVDDTLDAVAGTPVTFDPTTNDSDADGDALTLAVPVQPAHGTVTVSGHDVTYTPAEGYAGPDTIAYTVCDAANACDVGAVAVTVALPPNSAPVAVTDVVTVTEGTPLTFDPRANDTDADGDTLLLTTLVQPAHGTATTDGSTVTYTPAAGYSGPDSFTYTVCDTTPACDTGTVDVTVQQAAPPVNNAPVADAGTKQTVAPGTTVTLHGSATDADLDPLTYTWAQTGGPSVTLSDAHALAPTFTAPAAAGTLTFTLTVFDGALSDVDSVTVVVTKPAAHVDPPGCDAASATTPVDTAVTVDVPCDAGTAAIATPPAHGTAEVLPDGTVRYVPDAGYSGTDTFTVRSCTTVCETATVTVQVRPNRLVRDDRVTPTLPRTGSPVDVLVPVAFVLVVVGAAAYRKGRFALDA